MTGCYGPSKGAEMDKETYEIADPIVDKIAEAASDLLESPETERLRTLLADLSEAIGSRYSVSLLLNVEVFDQDREQALPLLQTGLTGFESDKPYQAWSDSSAQRYVAGGEMLIAPHDHCPLCWGVWDFKFKVETCPHCGATMGKEVKLLLDNDLCPYCNDGKVSMANPRCDKCGYTVESDKVVWG